MPQDHSHIAASILRLFACIASVGPCTTASGQIAPQAIPPAGSNCGTLLTPEDAAVILANMEAGLYEGAAIRGADLWYVPVTMHVVRQSNGSGGLSESRLSTALNDLNSAFAPQLVFYRSGPTRYIDSDAFYFNIDTLSEINDLRQTDVVAGTVNMYFTENLVDDFGDPSCGSSTFTVASIQGIVMRNGCTALPDNHSTGPHLVGHYFDLYHTHETRFGAECVNRGNCENTGDLLCDTSADPGLHEGNVNSSCQYTGTERDSCHDFLFQPQEWNLMSNAPAECRTAFTTEQKERALDTLQSLRPELASVSDACAAAAFVNRGFPNSGTGTPFFPYDTLDEGIQAVPDGGCVIIGAGDYSAAPITISRPMTLHAPLGLVRIGP